ncbi:hypothetical protein JOC86_000089 [Bacillus pakistanensis]|uniref:Uncharacterized protein n=1 Tax=Rossellomorea pakistanensis TaxID=992288 RepID=A0ABS2N6R9_9BACI|nr:hypothetical protein [Bacillus pakistanensis]
MSETFHLKFINIPKIKMTCLIEGKWTYPTATLIMAVHKKKRIIWK